MRFLLLKFFFTVILLLQFIEIGAFNEDYKKHLWKCQSISVIKLEIVDE